MATILVVDDENAIRRILSLFLTDRGHLVVEASTGEEAVSAADRTAFDLAVVDYSLPGIDGLQTLGRLRERDPALASVFMTAHGSIRSAVDAIRAGASDYLTKPFDNEQLLLAIQKALEVRRLTNEVRRLRLELEAKPEFAGMVGISAPMKEVFRIMTRVSANEGTVLVLGESGTGKELVARAIHRRSPRAGGPFVAVNCSAIPATLIESEFFGTERGAFTDAKESRPGRFELARQGTLFLDEVGDLPLEAQAKLLRALQEKEITRLGGRRTVPIDVRVIAATNKDLHGEVDAGRFRQDLYFRLDVLSLRLPPLRERGEDVGILIDHFLAELGREAGAAELPLSAEARRLLLTYDWPGNVRELENVLRRALVVSDGSAIRAVDLPARLRGASETSSEAPSEQSSLATMVARTVERVERALIQSALAACRGNRSAAAEQLGINRKTLFNKMRQYGLAPGEDEPA
jgi:DNA-binding NtrC family response regulator